MINVKKQTESMLNEFQFSPFKGSKYGKFAGLLQDIRRVEREPTATRNSNIP